MRRFLFLLAIVCLAFAADSKKSKKKTPEPVVDQEEHYHCRGNSGFHPCSCQAQVSRVVMEYTEACHENAHSAKDLEECLAHSPAYCDVIKKPDEKVPVNTCKRTCTKARCRCSDGPACFLPPFPSVDPEQGEQQQ